jgi:hypothetical protein
LDFAAAAMSERGSCERPERPVTLVRHGGDLDTRPGYREQQLHQAGPQPAPGPAGPP